MQQKSAFGSTSLSTGLIREWKSESHPILGARGPRDMTFSSRVFDQVDVPRLEGDLFSSRNFNLSSATECDHVLAPWATMPIGNRTGRTAMKLGPGDLHQLERLTRVSGCELTSTSSACV